MRTEYLKEQFKNFPGQDIDQFIGTLGIGAAENILLENSHVSLGGDYQQAACRILTQFQILLKNGVDCTPHSPQYETVINYLSGLVVE